MIGARLLFSTWLTNTFIKRTPFVLLYSLFTIPKNYLLPAKRKVSYMSGKLSMSVLYWIFSNHLHLYCIHCKRRGMQQCHVFLNCCHVEKMTPVVILSPAVATAADVHCKRPPAGGQWLAVYMHDPSTALF